MMTARQLEIEKNYQYFQTVVGSWVATHQGQYALLHSEKIVGIYAALAEAVNVGHTRFQDGVFSIQEVTVGPLDLGFYSHASGNGDLLQQ